MWDSICSTVSAYGEFYIDFAKQQWNNMSPPKYVALLLTVGTIGWVMMKNGARR